MNSRPSTTCGCGPCPCRGRIASLEEPPNHSRPSGALTSLSCETRVLAASACSCVQLALSGRAPSRTSNETSPTVFHAAPVRRSFSLTASDLATSACIVNTATPPNGRRLANNFATSAVRASSFAGSIGATIRLAKYGGSETPSGSASSTATRSHPTPAARSLLRSASTIMASCSMTTMRNELCRASSKIGSPWPAPRMRA